VTAQRIRLTVRHQPGLRTGVKEVLVLSTGTAAAPQRNRRPAVDAYVDTAATAAPGAVPITGSVKDDGLPDGQLTSTWSVISAPEGATAVIDAPARPTTSLFVTKGGTYVLRLSATDGKLSTSTDLTVQAPDPARAGPNIAPLRHAHRRLHRRLEHHRGGQGRQGRQQRRCPGRPVGHLVGYPAGDPLAAVHLAGTGPAGRLGHHVLARLGARDR
jgi:hypothetical protein